MNSKLPEIVLGFLLTVALSAIASLFVRFTGFSYEGLKDFAGPAATVLAASTAALIAIAIARVQVSVAKIQANTANDKLVLDLFERRIEIYSNARAVIARIMTSGGIAPEDHFEFLRAIDGSKFLFGPEVSAYWDTLYLAIIDAEAAEHETKAARGEAERRTALETRRNHRETLNGFYKQTEQLLAPYLSAHQTFSLNLNAKGQRRDGGKR